MVKKNKGVMVTLDCDFFDNMFEPARRNMEEQLGMRIGQKKFTHILSKKKINPFSQKNLNIFKNVKKTKKR